MRQTRITPINIKLSFIKQLLNESDRVLLVVDRNATIVLINRAAQVFLGMNAKAIVGKNLNELFALPGSSDELHGNPNLIINLENLIGTYWVGKHGKQETPITFTGSRLNGLGEPLFILSGINSDKPANFKWEKLNKTLSLIDGFTSGEGDVSFNLAKIAQQMVPTFADWCIIHSINPIGHVERVSTYPLEMINNQALYDWLDGDLLTDDIEGLAFVINTRKMVLANSINPIRRAASAGVNSYLILPIVLEDKAIGTFTLVRTKSNRQFEKHTVELLLNIVSLIRLAIDNSELFNENRKLKSDLENQIGKGSAELDDAMEHLKQSDELIQALFRISNRLNATLDLDQILDTLAQEAIQLVNGESGFAGLRVGDAMTVKKYYSLGSEIPFEHTWATGDGIPGWVLKYKVPYGTSDADNDPIINKDLSINANVHSIICTPILDTFGEVIAYFDIRNKIGSEGFSISDQEMLLTLAPVASIAIQNAMAYQQRLNTVSELKDSAIKYQELAISLEKAREEERVKIARDLHDQLGQALTVIKFDMTWLAEQLNREIDPSLALKTKDIVLQINSLINLVRRIATGLRPGMLEDLGLVASLEWQAEDFEKRTGIKCDFHKPDDELTLTYDQSLVLYRICQEALTNVERYSEANMVIISLKKSAEAITFELSDDGKGITPQDGSSDFSVGIMGMRERAEQLGGVFEISGIPGNGTRIKVTLPIQKIGESKVLEN